MAITWEEPIVTWNSNEGYHFTDWNRVVRDTGYLLNVIEYPLYDETMFLESHIVEDNDPWRLTEWQTMRNLLALVNTELQVVSFELPGDTVTAVDINKMETLLLIAKNKIDQQVARQYANDGLRSGDPEIYAR